MKKSFLFLFYFVAVYLINAQTAHEIIFQSKLSDLPFPIRIENCGVYAISNFDVKDNIIGIKNFDRQEIYYFSENKPLKSVIDKNEFKSASDIFETSFSSLKKLPIESRDNAVVFKKSFLNSKSSLFYDNGGIMKSATGDRIEVLVKNRNILELNFELENFNKKILLNFPSNLGCAGLIGIDANGNIFITTETYISDIPLKVKRSVYVLSAEGQIQSILDIPPVKFIYTMSDFQIDQEGNLYYLHTNKEYLYVIKFSGLTNCNGEFVEFPFQYNYELSFNDFTEVKEPQTQEFGPLAAGNRFEALKIGEAFALHKYKCSSNNLAPTEVTAPGGDIVKTPSWLIVGDNARIPYKWGGFNTLAQFDEGLLNGKYAGDIHTSGVSSWAVGLDCSGFVSRCWQLTYHSSTSNMPSITTQYSSWDSLKPGDAIHKVGHVRLFVERTPNGSFKIVEAASRNWDVSYWTFTLASLSDYTPRYYNGMDSHYSFRQPKFIAAVVAQNGKAQLSWICDTTGLKGFRLYKSIDGKSWTQLLNENTLKFTSVEIENVQNANYYRVSSILNNPPYFSESAWSNPYCVGVFESEKRILIVDGFEVETGSWRGAGHPFSVRYGQALSELSKRFDCVKNSVIIDSSVILDDYDAVFWICGDESSVTESFNDVEQEKFKRYLENGGYIFVSGSEIGYDLYDKGTTNEKAFYNNYFKANYIADNSGSLVATGVSNLCFENLSFNFGQVYVEDFPDEISAYGGSQLCMKYGNNKGAGICYTGTFGASSDTGKIIYLAFPLETTASDSAFKAVIANSINYFFTETPNAIVCLSDKFTYNLAQNYPNPFNPETNIVFELKDKNHVKLQVFDAIGKEITTLINEEKPAGIYSVKFNAEGFPSGVYFYRLQSEEFIQTKKMILLK